MNENKPTAPHQSALAIDCASEADRIGAFIVATLRKLNRRGCVLGVSGGVDSAVCAHLAARAVGSDRVLALLMPERDSTKEAGARARRLCDSLGIPHVEEDITDPLEAIGCYRRRDEAIRKQFPDYGAGWRQKIAIVAGKTWMPQFNLIVQSPDGQIFERRLPVDAYLQIVAATNFKQRLRKSMEYYHAERLNYGVLGTPNKLEYDLGFFVRGGDGLADFKPIAHLYKTQVYALAEHLGVPDEIRREPPSTDTYSLTQSQEEFYFALSWSDADRVLHGMSEKLSAAEIAIAVGRDRSTVARAIQEFQGKRRAASRALAQAYVLGGGAS
ncbi:NAD+ synthase [Rhodoblastus sphagnicola]|uniref:NAD(+) synthase n=1 Tax=Rhodoblastus sphagnicola TaxID=333368 RepID=UPI001859C107|nr:NAD(+) synthase [Rhodoblastus sphagnicola]MBB4200416.1 NAD+ synthase [Rhodoblastus sphagnicola]